MTKSSEIDVVINNGDDDDDDDDEGDDDDDDDDDNDEKTLLCFISWRFATGVRRYRRCPSLPSRSKCRPGYI